MSSKDNRVEEIQNDIENIHVNDNVDNFDSNNRARSAPGLSRSSSSYRQQVAGFDKTGSDFASHSEKMPGFAKQEAWSWGANPNPNPAPSSNVVSTNGADSNRNMGANLCTPAPNRASSEQEPVGTLEAMHRMLDQSYMNENGERSPSNTIDYLSKNINSYSNNKGVSSMKGGKMERIQTKAWVVRYVDYTSKYGLGYLLNTGAAGVYFNDSTKIVLSPDGTIFQYIERRKSDSNFVTDASTQFHSLFAYPVELQKKVLLLKHFKNYLIEQHKSCMAGNEGNSNYSEPVQSLPMMQDNGVGSGANPNIPFGFSSIFNVTGSDRLNIEESSDMVFVKKWVRTRHAILFRLSNKTVHVVFFDRSEVMLSSEDRVITYVNKQGSRQEFMLEDVMANGPLEVNKRLRYTKDIMYKLINPNAN
jgi:polo-like kinase 1